MRDIHNHVASAKVRISGDFKDIEHPRDYHSGRRQRLCQIVTVAFPSSRLDRGIERILVDLALLDGVELAGIQCGTRENCSQRRPLLIRLTGDGHPPIRAGAWVDTMR
jgi:hypothetical protein